MNDPLRFNSVPSMVFDSVAAFTFLGILTALSWVNVLNGGRQNGTVDDRWCARIGMRCSRGALKEQHGCENGRVEANHAGY